MHEEERRKDMEIKAKEPGRHPKEEGFPL